MAAPFGRKMHLPFFVLSVLSGSLLAINAAGMTGHTHFPGRNEPFTGAFVMH